ELTGARAVAGIGVVASGVARTATRASGRLELARGRAAIAVGGVAVVACLAGFDDSVSADRTNRQQRGLGDTVIFRLVDVALRVDGDGLLTGKAVRIHCLAEFS